ncbi:MULTISPECIES: hypothetical protein [Xenorhabdus]|uniref:hypothetical protein n=1 Tax=Xenorhabdus TaxID=626 RepID=UPI00064A9587|nr:MULTISPECIES: hypothetical protein [Xenorhabdus]KLU14703.1 hypothetical protein AAY47_14830 [Xenorhabdus griffiniae]KOP31660.1 hypothetical protein AFK69_19710 [Xenorhabdus sp. GDc328]
MIVEKYYPFEFSVEESIPAPLARELIAIKQVLVAIIATDYEKRQVIVDGLSKSDCPIIKNIVDNIKLIDEAQHQ